MNSHSPIRLTRRTLLAGAALSSLALPARAQTFPSKALRVE